MSIENVAWAEILRILGARAVLVAAVDTRRLLRVDAVDAVPDGEVIPDGEKVAELTAALAETAAELVRHTEPSITMDDLLVTGPTWYHVLRVFDGAEAGACVAHLVLDRRLANLALARREFRALLDVTRDVEATTATRAPLPRRTPGATEAPWARARPREPSAWFTSTLPETQFETDRQTLHRLRDGLRRLPDGPAEATA